MILLCREHMMTQPHAYPLELLDHSGSLDYIAQSSQTEPLSRVSNSRIGARYGWDQQTSHVGAQYRPKSLKGIIFHQAPQTVPLRLSWKRIEVLENPCEVLLHLTEFSEYKATRVTAEILTTTTTLKSLALDCELKVHFIESECW